MFHIVMQIRKVKKLITNEKQSHENTSKLWFTTLLNAIHYLKLLSTHNGHLELKTIKSKYIKDSVSNVISSYLQNHLCKQNIISTTNKVMR